MYIAVGIPGKAWPSWLGFQLNIVERGRVYPNLAKPGLAWCQAVKDLFGEPELSMPNHGRRDRDFDLRKKRSCFNKKDNVFWVNVFHVF